MNSGFADGKQLDLLVTPRGFEPSASGLEMGVTVAMIYQSLPILAPLFR